MKKLTLRLLRGMKGSMGQFWSMVFIIAIGSAMFAGMSAAHEAMTDGVNQYFEAQNLADLWCYFEGVTQDEIDNLFSSSQEVIAAEGRYAYLANLTALGHESELLIRSITGINRSLLTEGAMPEYANEIIVDNQYAAVNNLKLGGALPIETETGSKFLTITGFCRNPEAVVIQKDALSASVNHSAFGIAYGTNETLIDLNRASPLYQELFQELSQTLSAARNELNDADQQITQAWDEYESAKQDVEMELSGAQEKLEDSSQKIHEGSQTLTSQKKQAENQYNELRIKLEDAQRQLEDAKQQSERELEKAKSALDSAKQQIEVNQAEWESQKETATREYEDAKKQIAEAEVQWEDAARKLQETQAELDSAKQELDGEQAELARTEQEGRAQLLEGAEQIEDARNQLLQKQTQAEAELEDAQTQLDSAQNQIQAGESELRLQKSAAALQTADIEAKLREAEKGLEDSEKNLNAEYAQYQAIREMLPPEQQSIQDAAFAGYFENLENEKSRLTAPKNELNEKAKEAEALFAQKENELAQAKVTYAQNARELAAQRAKAAALLVEAQTEIDNQQIEFNAKWVEGEAGLEEAKGLIAEAALEYDKARQEFTQRKEQAEADLKAAREEIDAKRAKLATEWKNGQRQLAEAEAQIAEAKETYERKTREYASQKMDTEKQLADAQAEIDNQRRQLEEQHDQGQSSIASIEAAIGTAQQAYDEGLNEFIDQKENLESQLGKVNNEISSQYHTLTEKKAELEDKEEEVQSNLKTAVTSYQEVLLRTNEPEAVKNLVRQNEKYIAAIERKDHTSYIAVDASLDPIRKLSFILPVIFFLVAAVIAFISISKMVDVQRTQIAVMRAIGVPKWKIQAVFLLYAFAAAFLGSVGFSLFGNIFIPQYLIKAFTITLDMPKIYVPIYPAYMAVILALAFLFTGSAALLAARRTLSENPAQGMRPSAPKVMKATWIERIESFWSRLSAMSKMACRSMLRNKSRILLSSIGIIGSEALLMTGFSLRSGAAAVLDAQVDIANYDVFVTYSEPSSASPLFFPFDAEILEWADVKQATVQVGQGVPIRVQMLESGNRLINFLDKHGNKVPFGKDSCIIPRAIAEEYGLAIGGALTLTVNDAAYTFTITGINEQYLSKRIFLDIEAAENAGIRVDREMAFVKLRNPADIAEVENSGLFSSVVTKQSYVDKAAEVMTVVNAIIALLIVASSILAIAVVYNVSSVNILDRTQEYATVLALGYSVKQVNGMIIAENIFLTAFGASLGMPLGFMLFQYLIRLLSRDDLTLNNRFSVGAAVGSILFSFALAALSNALLRHKIQKIPLTECLKGV
ncbi:MAG: FtsX-like permease family protein [Clostridiales bacterium]|jgi:putative ABC transport system permease protein|nr:FtsX-like permease family protein [Clostridiales bacterium]